MRLSPNTAPGASRVTAVTSRPTGRRSSWSLVRVKFDSTVDMSRVRATAPETTTRWASPAKLAKAPAPAVTTTWRVSLPPPVTVTVTV